MPVTTDMLLGARHSGWASFPWFWIHAGLIEFAKT